MCLEIVEKGRHYMPDVIGFSAAGVADILVFARDEANLRFIKLDMKLHGS